MQMHMVSSFLQIPGALPDDIKNFLRPGILVIRIIGMIFAYYLEPSRGV